MRKNKKVSYSLVGIGILILGTFAFMSKTYFQKPEAERKVASNEKKSPSLKRKILGTKKTPTPTRFSNVSSKKWKAKFKENFFKNIDKDSIKDFKLVSKTSLTKVQNQTGRHLEHVLVSYKNKEGLPYSFEALIDTENAQVLRSWNKTKYERRKKLQINFENYKFEDN